MIDDERSSAALLARLRGEIAEDRVLLARCDQDADVARGRLVGTPDDPAVLALAAVSIHGWYTGLETLLERIARQLDRDVPSGPRWHRELLTQLSVDVPRVRPAVLPLSTIQPLAELLAFRHFFRHAYGVILDRGRLGAHLETLATVSPAVGSALDRFDEVLGGASS